MEQLVVHCQLVVGASARDVVRVVEELLAHILCDMRKEVRGEGRRLYVDEPHAHGRAPFIVERPRPPSAGLSENKPCYKGHASILWQWVI